jgi:hypothetical protein
MKRRLILLFGVAVLLAWSIAPAAAGVPEALDWLRARQGADGGFAGDSGSASSAPATVEAVFAIVSGGQDPAAWARDGNTPLSFLESQVDEALKTPGDTAKLILAALAAGRDPRQFGGTDLVASLEATQDDSHIYGGTEAGNVFAQSLAILALQASRRPVSGPAVEWLVSVQLDDGSWSWNADTTPGSGDSNSTALAAQALQAAGGQEAAVASALEYLRSLQNDDGGFPYQKPSDFGTDTDANSTAYVIQALIATGHDPNGEDWAVNGATPVEALAALQQDSGAFVWQAAVPGENYLATAQAIPALAGKAFLDISGSRDTGQVPAPAQLPASGGVGLATVVRRAILTGLGLALAATGLAVRRRFS